MSLLHTRVPAGLFNTYLLGLSGAAASAELPAAGGNSAGTAQCVGKAHAAELVSPPCG
jgi:hypothetical protein